MVDPSPATDVVYKCGAPSVVVRDPSIMEYNFGPHHPMTPRRVELTMGLAESLGVFDLLQVVDSTPASLDQLLTVHDPAYIEAVERAGNDLKVNERFGIGTEDDPAFRHMHEASSGIAGASIEAARRVWQGEAIHAANISGGMHHAMPDMASGFCIYNDVAMAIKWLLANGAERIAYVDVDVHHGDGVEKVFYDDPRVMTISLHETGQMLFPGTGFATDIGAPGAEGTAVNVALPPGTADSGWLRAFYAVVPQLVREFNPDILVTQHGCDSHREDPLAHLQLTVDGQRASYRALHELAHDTAGGKWLAVGGGGYSIVDVVPRAWTHLLAILSGAPIDPETPTPMEWHEQVAQVTSGGHAPATMTDGGSPFFPRWENGFDPSTWLDRSIHATREAVFPLHGLDLWF